MFWREKGFFSNGVLHEISWRPIFSINFDVKCNEKQHFIENISFCRMLHDFVIYFISILIGDNN